MHHHEPPSPQRKWKPEPIERPILPSTLKTRRDILELQGNDVEELAHQLESRMSNILAGYTQLNEMAVNVPDSLEGFANELSGCARKIVSDAQILGLDEKHTSNIQEFPRLDLDNAYLSIREAHGSHVDISRDLHLSGGTYHPSSHLLSAKPVPRTVPSSHMSKQSKVGRRGPKIDTLVPSSQDGFIPIPTFRPKLEPVAVETNVDIENDSKTTLNIRPTAKSIAAKAGQDKGKVNVAFGGVFRENQPVPLVKKMVKKRKVKRLKKRSNSKEKQVDEEPEIGTDACLRQESAPWVEQPIPCSPPSPPPSGPSERTIYRVLPVSRPESSHTPEYSFSDSSNGDSSNARHVSVIDVGVSGSPGKNSEKSEQAQQQQQQQQQQQRQEEREDEHEEEDEDEQDDVVEEQQENEKQENESEKEKQEKEEPEEPEDEEDEGGGVPIEMGMSHVKSHLTFGLDMCLYAAGGDYVTDELEEESDRVPHSPGYAVLELAGEGSVLEEVAETPFTKLFTANENTDTSLEVPRSKDSREKVCDKLSEYELHILTLILLANMADEVHGKKKQSVASFPQAPHLLTLPVPAPVPEDHEGESEEEEASDLASLVRCLVSEQRQNLDMQKQLFRHLQGQGQATTQPTRAVSPRTLAPSPRHSQTRDAPLTLSVNGSEGFHTLKSMDFVNTSDENHDQKQIGSDGFHSLKSMDFVTASDHDQEQITKVDFEDNEERLLVDNAEEANQTTATPGERRDVGGTQPKNFNSNWGHLLHAGPNFTTEV